MPNGDDELKKYAAKQSDEDDLAKYAAPPTPSVELPTPTPVPTLKSRAAEAYERLTSPYDPGATNVPERVLSSIGGSVLGTPGAIYSSIRHPLITAKGLGSQLSEAYKFYAPESIGGSPTPLNWQAIKGVLPEAIGTGIGQAAVGELGGKTAGAAKGAIELTPRILDKPGLVSGARDLMADRLDTMQKSIQDEATTRYNQIKAADTADWQAKLEAHKKALAEHTEKLKDPSYRGKPPARPSLGMPIADIQGAMDEKLGKISADTRAKMPRLEAAANEIQAAEAAPDFAHLQTLRNRLYNLAQGTSDNYEKAALTAGYDKATELMEARAKELGHSNTLSEANKKYALSSAIRDARMGSPKPADAYKKLADVTDKDIADTIKAAGPSGERVTAALREMKPLANIQKPYGPLGRIAVFKEHPVAAPAGSALGATTLGPLMPGFGHIMGMYAGALGAGELMDRLAAAKMLRKAGR